MIDKGVCQICGGWYRLDPDRRLVLHKHLKTDRFPCRGRWPQTDEPCYQEYAERSVSTFAEMTGGLPTLGRHRR